MSLGINRRCWLVLFAVTITGLALLGPRPASARGLDTLYTNFGSKTTKYVIGGWIEEGREQDSGPQANVFSFVPSEKAILRGVEMALTGGTYGTPMSIELTEDDKDRPGKIVFIRQVTVPDIEKCCKTIYVNVPKAKNVVLQPGLTYWVVTLAADDTAGGWFFNSTNAHAPMSRSYDDGATWRHAWTSKYPIGAFAVYGTPAR